MPETGLPRARSALALSPATRAADDCALAYRPGIVPRLRPPLNASESAWERATGASRARLDAFFAKLLRGETVTVYFLGESITRGTGANHGCLTCADARPLPDLRHEWIRPERVAAGGSGGQYAGTAAGCARMPERNDPYKPCLASRSAGCDQVCFPRNSWRCLTISWLLAVFPGQVRMRTSAKPLIFMASCFAAALTDVDLVVHEYAVNGGGRMLCLQERVLRAALMGAKRPAVLELLWVPKHFTPSESMLNRVQHNLADLGRHYDLPTLHMQRALSAPCARYAPGAHPTTGSWCYGRNASRGGPDEGLLHGDMYHSNVDGHAFFAAHVIELLERSAAAAKALGGEAAAATAGGGAAALRNALPAGLHALNRGLDSSGEGGSNLCLGVEQMGALARRNDGWSLSEERNSDGVKRLPALQAEALGAHIVWPIDLRGVAWLVVTYMQSYAGFGAVDVACVGGCECRMHTGRQVSPDVDASEQLIETGGGAQIAGVSNLINATSAGTKTSEPQWRIFDVVRADAAGGCELRMRTVAAGKFKLLLVSLIAITKPDDPNAAQLVRSSNTGAQGRDALQCFGVHDSPTGTRHGHGMVSIGANIQLDALSLDDSRYWTRAGSSLAKRRGD